MHGITTAIALSRHPDMEVHLIGASEDHLDYARRMIGRAGGAEIVLSLAGARLVHRLSGRRFMPAKLARLLTEAHHLAGFDAIALPERTSSLIRRLGMTGPRLIHLDHGAGDRAVGFDPRIRLFDFVLLPGAKTRRRLLREGYIRHGAHAVIGYPKFDAADALRDPTWTPFADDRPVVLYNPHFSTLGSWDRLGGQVLEAFAGQDRYNLIVAPHVRLFDGPAQREKASALVKRFHDHPRIHIDPGSERSVDMSYTMLADVYLGDVSSQIYEYLRRPRPCLFLDGQGLNWTTDENYAHWHFGPVLQDTRRLIAAVDAVRAEHARWAPAQAAGIAETFDLTAEPPSTRAAQAIATFLRFGAVNSQAETGAPADPPPLPRRYPRRARRHH